MAYQICAFQNCTAFPDKNGKVEQPSIKLTDQDAGWAEALSNWLRR